MNRSAAAKKAAVSSLPHEAFETTTGDQFAIAAVQAGGSLAGNDSSPASDILLAGRRGAQPLIPVSNPEKVCHSEDNKD
jgi:hypothetical protein